jgi:hypothetical protein
MGGSCCVNRNKFDFELTATEELIDKHIRLLNQLPTYENLIATYDCLL